MKKLIKNGKVDYLELSDGVIRDRSLVLDRDNNKIERAYGDGEAREYNNDPSRYKKIKGIKKPRYFCRLYTR